MAESNFSQYDMREILQAVLLLIIGSVSLPAIAQGCAPGPGVNCTPNIDLWVPEINSSNWGVFINADLSLIDSAYGHGGSGFPFTLGSTSIGASSTVTVVTGLAVDGVSPVTFGFLDATSSIQTQLNGKQGNLTLTTNGSSGASTLIGNTLNIPQYAGTGGGFPITLGSTSIAANSTTTTVSGLSVNGVTLSSIGSSALCLTQAGSYLSCGSGSVSGGTSGQVAIFGSATTITSGIALGSTGSDIPQLSGGLLNNSVINWAAPSAIGTGSPAGGSFTTLSVSSTVSGNGFSTYLASPPAIGGTSAAAGSFTTLSASSTVSGTGFSNYLTAALASPPAIGTTTPAAGKFSSIVDTAISAGTSPICPNGSGGAFTTSGCSGGGGSGTVNSGTSGYFTYYATTGTAVSYNPHLDDGVTTASTVTSSEPVAATSYTAPGDGTHAGYAALYGNTTLPTLVTGDFNLIGPNSASVTAYGWQVPTAVNGSAGILHVGAPTSSVSQLSVSTIATADIAANAVTAAKLATQYSTWSCETGLGDGFNAIPADTYLQSFCYNTTGVTVTLTGLKCYIDGGSSSTMNAAGNTLGALLTGAVTCSTSFAAGTQSANVSLTNGDYIKFTFVADGTAKQTTFVVTGTY